MDMGPSDYSQPLNIVGRCSGDLNGPGVVERDGLPGQLVQEKGVIFACLVGPGQTAQETVAGFARSLYGNNPAMIQGSGHDRLSGECGQDQDGNEKEQFPAVERQQHTLDLW
jgi:hypothetical protein